MKKYLYVTPFFPSPDNWRGAYCLDFVRALQRELELRVGVGEWKVLVFVPGAGEDYEIGGITVHTFKTYQLPSNIFPFFFARFNTRSFLNKLKEVLNSTVDLDLQPRPQTLTSVKVCHANTALFSIYPLAVKKLNPECRTLLHHHDLQSFGLNGGILSHCWLYNMCGFPILRKLHEQIDCHVFISEASRRSFLSAPNTDWTDYAPYKKQMRGLPYRPVRIKRSIILHNGVDTAIFNREVEVGGGGREKDLSTFAIGCIGNFEVLKDQETLIRAVGLLKEPVKVIFVGSGPTLEGCKKLANSIVDLDLQPQFEFRTEVPHEQLADFYHSIDLFVLPSTFEGFGCVYTEAWACGVPFIACEGQGVEDVIVAEERTLWLCKQHDQNDLACKVEYFFNHNPAQHMAAPISMDKIVGNFVREVGLV